jgi:hypothetical protein
MKTRVFFLSILGAGLILIVLIDRLMTSRYREDVYAGLVRTANLVAERLCAEVEKRLAFTQAIAWIAASSDLSEQRFREIVELESSPFGTLRWVALTDKDLNVRLWWARSPKDTPPARLSVSEAAALAEERVLRQRTAVGAHVRDDGLVSLAFAAHVGGKEISQGYAFALFRSRDPFRSDLRAAWMRGLYLRLADRMGASMVGINSDREPHEIVETQVRVAGARCGSR